jgi:hypothetical protein
LKTTYNEGGRSRLVGGIRVGNNRLCKAHNRCTSSVHRAGDRARGHALGRSDLLENGLGDAACEELVAGLDGLDRLCAKRSRACFGCLSRGRGGEGADDEEQLQEPHSGEMHHCEG